MVGVSNGASGELSGISMGVEGVVVGRNGVVNDVALRLSSDRVSTTSGLRVVVVVLVGPGTVEAVVVLDILTVLGVDVVTEGVVVVVFVVVEIIVLGVVLVGKAEVVDDVTELEDVEGSLDSVELMPVDEVVVGVVVATVEGVEGLSRISSSISKTVSSSSSSSSRHGPVHSCTLLGSSLSRQDRPPTQDTRLNCTPSPQSAEHWKKAIMRVRE